LVWSGTVLFAGCVSDVAANLPPATEPGMATVHHPDSAATLAGLGESSALTLDSAVIAGLWRWS
jgi:hypothetical protein